MASIARAFYRQPAFLPHRLLRKLGIEAFWAQNAIVTASIAVLLTIGAWIDGSFFIRGGYGYLQHPGVAGWYLVQVFMPLAIYRLLTTAANAEKHYRELLPSGDAFNFDDKILQPLTRFIALRTAASRTVFALLFTIGFAGFAWNTFQNLAPGRLAPLDFWDSIHYPFGYAFSRVHKCYLDALLLPSLVHIFVAIVWTNIRALCGLNAAGRLHLAPFNVDRCGGFGFLSDLILAPTISALLVSALAFVGVVYTHRAFDTSTVGGVAIQTAILVTFYMLPTFVLRSLIVQTKRRAARDVSRRQQEYYEAILAGSLHGDALREAHEYLRYFTEACSAIGRVPEWPHLMKASSAFGISISPAILSSLVSVAKTLWALYPKLHPSLP